MEVAFTAPASYVDRAMSMINHFLEDESDEFEVSAGFMTVGDARFRSVVVKIGAKRYPFSIPEVRHLAQGLQETMEAFPGTDMSDIVPDIIMGIRYAADQAEKFVEEA